MRNILKPSKGIFFNQEKNANYQPNSNRMAKVHEQDNEDEDPPENLEPDLDNYHAEVISYAGLRY